MIEEVVDPGLEGIDIEQPATVGDLHTELVLLIPLPVQQFKGRIACRGKLHDRSLCREQRRRLIEAAVEAPEDPVQLRNPYRYPEARIGRGLGELASEEGLAQACDQGEPRGGLVVVRNILLDHTAGGRVRDREGCGSGIVVEHGSEEVAVVLAEGVEAGSQRIACNLCGDRGLRSGVVRGAIRRGRHGCVSGARLIVRPVVVIEGRDLQHRGWVEGMEP